MLRTLALLLRGGFALALTSAISVDVAAGRVERFADDLWGSVELAIPESSEGVWRTRTQLVWDSPAGKLSRRSYRVWDSLPSLDLEFLWIPEDTLADSAGAVTGTGTLSWRKRGSASYDSAATVATYRGDMYQGRAHGEGRYLHRSGVSYRGTWRDGLMHGHGRLLLPNGDEYLGDFHRGRQQDYGVYVDALGNSYEGGFAQGVRDGQATVIRPNATSYRALFRAGTEIAGTRIALDPHPSSLRYLPVANYPSYDDARVGIIVDRRPVFRSGSAEDRHLLYTSESDGETLRIFPDNDRFMDIWRREAQVVPNELMVDERHILDFGELVPLIFELENRSSRTLQISEAFLDVGRSVTEARPLIRLTSLSSGFSTSTSAGYSQCDYEFFSPALGLANYGWGPAENARIEFTFTDADGGGAVGSGSRVIGRIDNKMLEIGLLDELIGLGLQTYLEKVDSLTVRAKGFSCSSRDRAACVREVGATGVFGSLRDLVWLEWDSFNVGIRGTLEYDWRDASGVLNHKTSRFKTQVSVGREHHGQDGCVGEGGNPGEARRDPFRFDLDRERYRIPVPLRDNIPAGVTGRWRLTLEAEKSSSHDFRLVLQLADGRQVASRPIDLLYIRPAPVGK